jgi:hypothetical protein
MLDRGTKKQNSEDNIKTILWKCTALIFLGIKSLRILER